MSCRRVLNAGPEGWAGWIRPEVQELKVVFVLSAESDPGHSTANRVDVEFNGSVAEGDVFECRLAAVQPHQAMVETQLPEELRVLLGLPALSRHGDWDRFCALRNRKC